MKALLLVLSRLREPSTFAGIAALSSAFGFPDMATEAGVNLVAGIAGVAAILMPEGSKGG